MGMDSKLSNMFVFRLHVSQLVTGLALFCCCEDDGFKGLGAEIRWKMRFESISN